MTTTVTGDPDRPARIRDRATRAQHVNRIRELAGAGNNDKQIAAELGLCAATVRRERNANNIPPGFDPASTRATEHGSPGMSRRCNCTVCDEASKARHAEYVQSVAARLAKSATNARKPWTAADDAIVMDTSISVSEAAVRLGRTWYAITGRRNKLRTRDDG